MKPLCNVLLPVNFNCWKHHAGFIKEQILATRSEQDLKELSNYLLKIGESQMDIYIGNNSPKEISTQIIKQLKSKNLFEHKNYKKWIIEDENRYHKLTISDNSTWILRLGEDNEKYVHIHPGRYSPQTIRVKATTLKTAIMISCCQHIGELKVVDTESVNNIRLNYLNEPPLKSLAIAGGIRRLVDLLS